MLLIAAILLIFMVYGIIVSLDGSFKPQITRSVRHGIYKQKRFEWLYRINTG